MDCGGYYSLVAGDRWIYYDGVQTTITTVLIAMRLFCLGLCNVAVNVEVAFCGGRFKVDGYVWVADSF